MEMQIFINSIKDCRTSLWLCPLTPLWRSTMSSVDTQEEEERTRKRWDKADGWVHGKAHLL